MLKLKKNISVKHIIVMICLLVTVGIFYINNTLEVHATNLGESIDVTGQLSQTPTQATSGTQTGTEPTASTSGFTITYENGNGTLNSSLRILFTLTFIALTPTLLVLLTSYTRTIIVLHFTRSALNTQTAPPNQVLIGLALFLTFFIMAPTFEQVYENAIRPFDEGAITQEEFFKEAIEPMREFMYGEVQVKDVELFMNIASMEWDGALNSIPLSVLVPSFIIGELRVAFFIGFMIYIPFIVIDMVVASTLMSMGMMMLPPTTISMPFKILLFVLADGWSLIILNTVQTFYK